MSSRSKDANTLKFENLTMIIQQSVQAQKKAPEVSEERFRKLEDSMRRKALTTDGTMNDGDSSPTAPSQSSQGQNDLIKKMEAMMDSKITKANKEWEMKMQQMNDANQKSLIDYTSARWTELNSKLESTFEIFAARTSGLPEFMAKMDRLLDRTSAQKNRNSGEFFTNCPGKKQKLMATPPMAPGDRVIME